MTRGGWLCMFAAVGVAAVAVVWVVRTGGADEANVRWDGAAEVPRKVRRRRNADSEDS